MKASADLARIGASVYPQGNEGFKDQFKSLLIAIEAGKPLLARSMSKRERELKRLSCTMIGKEVPVEGGTMIG